MTDTQIDARTREINARAIALNNGEFCGSAKYQTDEEKKELKELNFRRMIISCLTYNGAKQIRDDKTGAWGRYGAEYANELGIKRATEVWEEQRDFFKEHAKVSHGVYTDCEGCTYNSVSWS